MKDRIIFKIDSDTKKEFKNTCDVLGLDMTTVLIASIKNFIEESKKSPKK